MRVDLPTPDGPERTTRRESAAGAIVDALRVMLVGDGGEVKYLVRGEEACTGFGDLKLGLVNLEIRNEEAPVGHKIKAYLPSGPRRLSKMRIELGTH